MKKFIVRLVVFLLLPALLMSVPLAALYFSGECLTKIDDQIAANNKYLIGYAYQESNYKYLKWKGLESKPRKDIWALGSSRVLQFREGMFSSSFYNAGFTIESIGDFKPFLEGINSSKYPKTIIISLDQWMFNANWDALEKPQKSKEFWKNSFDFLPTMGILKMTLKDIFKRKYSISAVFQHHESIKIGLQARVNDRGFRNDGSMTEGNDIQKLLKNDPSLEDYGFRNTLNRIELGTSRFETGDTLNTKSLVLLDEFLTFCVKNNIEVIAFLPPFAEPVDKALQTSGKHGYISNIENAVKPILNNHGLEFWNFQHLDLPGTSDLDMIDGFHGGELVHANMLIYMLEHGSTIQKHTQVSLLRHALNQQKNTFEVFSY